MPRAGATRQRKRTPTNVRAERTHAVSGPTRLTASQCRWVCDPRQFDFASTAELRPLGGIVGQHRAVEAIELGADIVSRGC
jgi:hypothetical protein